MPNPFEEVHEYWPTLPGDDDHHRRVVHRVSGPLRALQGRHIGEGRDGRNRARALIVILSATKNLGFTIQYVERPFTSFRVTV